jgi:hypothetical protein
VPPSPTLASRLLSAVSSLGQRAMGVRVNGGGGAGAGVAAGPVAARPPSGGAGRMDGAPQSVMDCNGPGCGGGAFFGGGAGFGYGALATAITPSLDRATIDDIYSDQLMRRIVRLIVDDALSVRPALTGETGELTPCIDWLDERGFFAEAERAMVYARQYGGGGVVCIIDDGRKASEEVDLLGLRDVVGFMAIPKWYLVPDGVGSSRVPAGWYGQRLGRPEHYYVTPAVALGDQRQVGAFGSAGQGVGAYKDFLKILAKAGNRFHRSRVIPWPYVDEMDLRLARWMAQWNGWGPGVVEAVLAPFLARRAGALRLAAIMNSVVVNTMTMTDLEHRQSTPDAGAAVRARLEFVKACRDFMNDSLPIIATDPSNKFDSLTHNVSGIDKLVAAQRQYLLDVVEYPGVVLFGDSVGGMNGGDRQGEHRTYAQRVNSLQRSWVWTAGSFGGGLRQAVMLAMACPTGPTAGQMDRTVKAEWPSILTQTEEDKATLRLKHAQARAQDRITLGLTPAAILRYDITLRNDYPGLDVDEGPLPTLAPPTPGLTAPEGTVPALDPSAASGEAAPPTTPGAVNEAITSGGEAGTPAAPDDAAPPPATLPADLMTEAELAAALKMTRASVRRLLAEGGVRPFVSSKGLRGGGRWSLADVLAAFKQQAQGRADAMRQV